MSRIFLSYSSADHLQAMGLRDWLSENGWGEAILEFDPNQGAPADRAQRHWREIATRCEAVVFLVSRTWMASQEPRSAYDVARKLDKAVFVALIEGFAPEQPLFDSLQSDRLVSLVSEDNLRSFLVASTGGEEDQEVVFSVEGLQRLKAGLAQVAADPLFFDWPPQSEPGRAPYRGLDSLEALDAGVFFGREEAMVAALDALRGLAEAPAPRIFILLGASGVGKSSFLRAGLWPRLERDKASFLPLPAIRPGLAAINGADGFVAAIALAAEKAGLATGASQIREALAGGVDQLRPLLKDLATRAAVGSTPPALVLAIDQAEELLCPESAGEGRGLLKLLRDLANRDDPAVIVILALRSDTYDALARSGLLQDLQPRIFALGPLQKDGYRAAIERPAQRVAQAGGTLEIDPNLTQALLGDLEEFGGDALPLLAFALEQLYRVFAATRRFALENYQGFGRLSGAIDAALARVFEAADRDPRIPKEREARLALLQRALVPWLAGVDPETRTARRRIARAEQIPEDARPLIDLLISQRLLTQKFNDASGETTLELAHEALLRRWGALKAWLDEDFERLARIESVKRAARKWEARSRLRAYATHVGALLEEAQRLYARPDFTALLDVTDRAYLAACMAEARLAREEEEAHSRAQEGQVREESKKMARRVRNARVAALSSSFGLAAALVGAALIGWQWLAATQAKREAQTQREHSEKTLAQLAGAANGLALGLAERLKDQSAAPAAMRADILDKARELQKQAASGGAAGADLQRGESVVLNEIAQARLEMGDFTDALAAARESATLMEALSAAKPDAANLRRDLSVAYEKLGDVQRATGDLTGALKSYRDDFTIAEALSATDAANAQWRWDLSTSNEKIGDVLQAQNDLDGALNAYREALAIREKISAADPGNSGWRRDLAVSYEHVGAALVKQGDAKGAIDAFERALAIYQALVRANPDDAQSATFSVVPHWRLAELDRAKQREHLEAAAGILRSLAAKDRLDARRRAWLAKIEAQLRALDQAATAPQPPPKPGDRGAPSPR